MHQFALSIRISGDQFAQAFAIPQQIFAKSSQSAFL
jgi:hypothetical protein